MTGITKNGKVYDGLEDPLHVYISGSTSEDVSNAAIRIQSLIDLHVFNPESEEVSFFSMFFHKNLFDKRALFLQTFFSRYRTRLTKKI